jgi:signal transduction histidine kinase
MDEAPNSPELYLFLASTAHDMKNSISVLSGTLERLIDGAAPPIAQPQMAQMAQMLYQTRRLNDNLMQLLALYKQVGKPGYPLDVQPLEVGHLADQVVAAARVLLESRGVTLDLDVERELLWHFDEDLVAGVVAHAINNAVHYTRDRIRLAIRQAGDCLEVRVEDNGDGYPAAMLDSAAALGSATCGINFLTNSTGLGLYFSTEVARMHRHRERRGALRLENGGAFGGGCFVLTLP